MTIYEYRNDHIRYTSIEMTIYEYRNDHIRLTTWKNHFAKLPNSDAIQTDEINEVDITPLYGQNFEMSCEPFTQQEVDTTIKQMKLRKAPGLDGLPLEFWKLPNARASFNRIL